VPVEIGQEAPDFTLKDQDGNDVTLSSFRGQQSVVLVFYPFTFTGVCQGELCEIRDDPSAFDAADAQVLAISCDTRHRRPRGRLPAASPAEASSACLGCTAGRTSVHRPPRASPAIRSRGSGRCWRRWPLHEGDPQGRRRRL